LTIKKAYQRSKRGLAVNSPPRSDTRSGRWKHRVGTRRRLPLGYHSYSTATWRQSKRRWARGRRL